MKFQFNPLTAEFEIKAAGSSGDGCCPETNTLLESINDQLVTTNTHLETIETEISDNGTKLDDIIGDLETIDASINSINDKLPALPNSNDLLLQSILNSSDRVQEFTYADFGTKNQRIIQITYSSATHPTATAVKDINYSLVSGRYRRDSIIWNLV